MPNQQSPSSAPPSVSRPRSAPDALEAILARERGWAARNGLATDAAGHLESPSDGLCFEPSGDTVARLARHPDRPLGEAGKRGSASELGSAWALACNVVEAIPTEALGGLLAAVGAEGRAVRRSFVHPPPSLEGEGARTPVAQIDREHGGPVFVEVHGAALARCSGSAPHALPLPETGWGDLEGCRRLAAECAQRFAALPLAGTLRRIRALTRSHGRRGFRYVVVRPHFDRHHDEALRRGYDGVRMRIGGEVDFEALDVAWLHARLAHAGEGAHPALAWLADRYLDRR